MTVSISVCGRYKILCLLAVFWCMKTPVEFESDFTQFSWLTLQHYVSPYKRQKGRKKRGSGRGKRSCVRPFVLSEVPEYMTDTRRLGLKWQHPSSWVRLSYKGKVLWEEGNLGWQGYSVGHAGVELGLKPDDLNSLFRANVIEERTKSHKLSSDLTHIQGWCLRAHNHTKSEI